ncbi:hypothetical protein Tco_1279822 [Tanacetum coccineum]
MDKPTKGPWPAIAYIPIATDIEFEPFEDPIETEETQPLCHRAAPLSPDDTSASPDYTLDTPHSDEDSEPMESFVTRIASPSGSTSPLSPVHALTQTLPTSTLSRAFYYHSTTRMARYRSSYETPSSSASPASSLTLPLWKRYRGTSELILDTKTEGNESEAEGIGSKSEESEDEGPRAARRRALDLAEDIAHSTYEVGQSSGSVPVQQTVEETTPPRLPVCATWEDLVDGTVYTDIECVMPPVHAPVQTLASPEWSSSSLPVSPASLTVPSPIASPETTLAATIAVEEDELIEVGAQLELHGSILHDHTQRLDVLPPTLFERYGLALEAWAGQADTQRAAMWQTRYEDQREILALRMQHAADQREM